MGRFSVLSGGALIKVDGVRILMERFRLELGLILVSPVVSVKSRHFNLLMFR